MLHDQAPAHLTVTTLDKEEWGKKLDEQTRKHGFGQVMTTWDVEGGTIGFFTTEGAWVTHYQHLSPDEELKNLALYLARDRAF